MPHSFLSPSGLRPSAIALVWRSGGCRRSIRPTPRFDNPRPQNSWRREEKNPLVIADIAATAMGNPMEISALIEAVDRKTHGKPYEHHLSMAHAHLVGGLNPSEKY